MKQAKFESDYAPGCYLKMTVGDRIRKVRIMRGLTQKELGKLVGLSDVRIRHYELDIRRPKYDTLKEIANALNIGVSSLMDTNIETLGDAKALLLALDKYVNIQLDGELDSKGKYKADSMSLTFKHPSIKKFLKEWADMKKDIDKFKENDIGENETKVYMRGNNSFIIPITDAIIMEGHGGGKDEICLINGDVEISEENAMLWLACINN